VRLPVLRLDRGWSAIVTSMPPPYEPGRTPEDVTPDPVEHRIGLAGILQAVTVQVDELVGANNERTVSVGVIPARQVQQVEHGCRRSADHCRYDQS
jgi:hypothetical protein